MSDLTFKFLIANLAAGIAILAVLILRKPVRTMFGAPFAYALWLLVPLVTIAALLPPRNIEIILPAAAPAPMPAPSVAVEPPPPTPAEATPAFREAVVAPKPQCVVDCSITSASPAPRSYTPTGTDLLALAWLIGAIAAIVWQLRNQSLFMADVRAGFAGPAVIGVLRPRIITPSDFEERFDAPEREIILAHETIHLTRNDARTNALVALVRCLCWFNPLVHAAAHFMRIDQELACDAAVVERHPRARGLYASALLKAQLAFRPLPLGCYWPAKAEHPLMQRIEMLKHARPGKTARLIGMSTLALLAIGSGLAAWATNPPVTHYTTASAPSADRPAPAPTPLEPQPLRDDPEPAPMPQSPPGPTAYDPIDPIYLRGKVERIDFSETKYTVFVRASSIGRSEIDEPVADTRLWELSPTSFWGDRDAVNADLRDSQVLVRGYGPKDKSCRPACKLLTRGIIVPKSTELPPVPPAANFGVTEVNQVYDVGESYSIVGTVQRIEFSDHVFDAYVLTEQEGLVPGRLFQVRSEYRFPRADVERRLLDQRISVVGWPARANISSMNLEMWSIYTNCAATCAMYGTDFLRDDDVRITPAGEQLAKAPTAPVRLFTATPIWMRNRNDVVLTGKVRSAKRYGQGIEFSLEEMSRAPAASAGPRSGTIWSVYFTPDSAGGLAFGDEGRTWIGRTVTVSGKSPLRLVRRGLDANTTSECQRDCQLATSDIMTFD